MKFLFLLCVYFFHTLYVNGDSSSNFGVSSLKARQKARGSRKWVSSQTLVVLESEESEEDHIDKNGYELCDAIGYDSRVKVGSDHVFFHIWYMIYCRFIKNKK